MAWARSSLGDGGMASTQPTEWQRIGNQINAMIRGRADFVNVLRASFATVQYHFGVAAWRAKEAEYMAREVLGDHHRKSPQRWMELGLRLSLGFRGADE